MASVALAASPESRRVVAGLGDRHARRVSSVRNTRRFKSNVDLQQFGRSSFENALEQCQVTDTTKELTM